MDSTLQQSCKHYCQPQSPPLSSCEGGGDGPAIGANDGAGVVGLVVGAKDGASVIALLGVTVGGFLSFFLLTLIQVLQTFLSSV